jgi:signal transduction histidine kinase
MAHDFGNVLNAIALNAHAIALAAAGNPTITNLVGQLIKATERGDYLAQELRSLGKDEPNKPRVVDPIELIEQIRGMLDVLAGPQVSLNISAIAPVSHVFVDPAQMERAIVNLVVNARDAMPTGGVINIVVREVIQGGKSADEGAHVVLEITDTGIGMDAGTRKHMFEPLFTTKGDKGTGIGLALVQRIVAMAGGFIDVESALGHGTTVRVHLPMIATPDRRKTS